MLLNSLIFCIYSWCVFRNVFITDICDVRVSLSSVVCVVFLYSIASLLVLFHLAIALPVFWLTASDYPFGVFKLFIHVNYIIHLHKPFSCYGWSVFIVTFSHFQLYDDSDFKADETPVYWKVLNCWL